jgi:transcription initiation factor TFIID subunit 10
MSTPQPSQGFAYPTTGYVPPAPAESPVAAGTPSQQSTQPAASTSAPTQTRQAAEEARKDRTLAEFMLMLDDYEPLVRKRFGCCLFESSSLMRLELQIPNEVTDYYLQRVGFECDDVRLYVNSISIYLVRTDSFSCRKRLLALAAQKFVSDIAADAYQHARIRTNAAGGRSRVSQPFSSGGHVKVLDSSLDSGFR